MSDPTYYRIGTLGTPWGQAERQAWLAQTKTHRSYHDDVVVPLQEFISQNNTVWESIQYGTLSYDNEKEYPLYAIKTRDWNDSKPSVCITGGVHGYETSGIHGALLFLVGASQEYSQHFNLLVFPCVSPWSYERMERWNARCQDPNRHFLLDKNTPETKAVMDCIQQQQEQQWTCHLDLHETTDSDETEYMPARAACEKGKPYTPETIPDGFFLMVNESKVDMEWCKSIIDSVKQELTLTTNKPKHSIAQPDDQGQILGEKVGAEGVVLLSSDDCVGDGMSLTQAKHHCTTELYPNDSNHFTAEVCNRAQVAAIQGALNYVIRKQHT